MSRRAPTYLDVVRTRPCAACGRGPAIAHHFIGEFSVGGVGTKAHDLFALPLCDRCHLEFHARPGEYRLEQREWLLRQLVWAAREGLVVTNEDACEVAILNIGAYGTGPG